MSLILREDNLFKAVRVSAREALESLVSEIKIGACYVDVKIFGTEPDDALLEVQDEASSLEILGDWWHVYFVEKIKSGYRLWFSGNQVNVTSEFLAHVRHKGMLRAKKEAKNFGNERVAAGNGAAPTGAFPSATWERGGTKC